jgi:hypothetical protein
MTSLSLLAAAIASGGLVQLLIWLLVLCLVVYCVFLIVGMLPLPEPAKKIVTIILAVVFLLVLLSHLGIIV